MKRASWEFGNETTVLITVMAAVIPIVISVVLSQNIVMNNTTVYIHNNLK